ncbi:MAG: cupin [Chloroflexota bacterium]|nr:cupin [Chloroflexota bacterium]
METGRRPARGWRDREAAMQRFRFDGEAAWPVTDYGSSFRLARLLRSPAGEVRVDIAFLGPGDSIGPHPAGLPQLFCVVVGSGWVQGGDGQEIAISGGQAAFWARGERHATRTDGGLTAVIVQAEALDPAAALVTI